jgi:NADH-quinone oxidoreductase subunit E
VSETAGFAFTPENEAAAKAAIGRYPPGRQASAVIALLTLAQQQHGGWLPQPALDYVADYLQMPPIRVYEVASFYDMLNTRPVGRTQVRVCTTTPCWLCGSDAVLKACKDVLGIEVGQSTADGRFFLREFECLGACANAPVLWVDDDYYEDLTYDTTKAMIEALLRGETLQPGPQSGRRVSMPAGGKTTLKADPHRAPKSRKEGPGKRDEEPVEKARPEAEVKEQAEKVERKGRPADDIGEEEPAEPPVELKDPDAR